MELLSNESEVLSIDTTQVMKCNMATSSWQPVTSEFIKVTLVRSSMGFVRVVGEEESGRVVVNSTLNRSSASQRPSQTFFQWKDTCDASMYGILFQNESDANVFIESLFTAFSQSFSCQTDIFPIFPPLKPFNANADLKNNAFSNHQLHSQQHQQHPPQQKQLKQRSSSSKAIKHHQELMTTTIEPNNILSNHRQSIETSRSTASFGMSQNHTEYVSSQNETNLFSIPSSNTLSSLKKSFSVQSDSSYNHSPLKATSSFPPAPPSQQNKPKLEMFNMYPLQPHLPTQPPKLPPKHHTQMTQPPVGKIQYAVPTVHKNQPLSNQLIPPPSQQLQLKSPQVPPQLPFSPPPKCSPSLQQQPQNAPSSFSSFQSPPPPPPPPPPPTTALTTPSPNIKQQKSQGIDLLTALNTTKLTKSPTDNDNNNNNNNNNNNINNNKGGKGGDLMSEMAQMMLKRKQKMQNFEETKSSSFETSENREGKSLAKSKSMSRLAQNQINNNNGNNNGRKNILTIQKTSDGIDQIDSCCYIRNADVQKNLSTKEFYEELARMRKDMDDFKLSVTNQINLMRRDLM